MTIGVALLGAGIFATDQHLPAIQACPDLSFKAVYSRSKTSAEAFVKSSQSDVDVYSDDSANSLEALLQRQDIQAVIIAVPIHATAGLIRQALAAGKHVLSEKPIAADMATARSLVDYHQNIPSSKRTIWAVGENFRFWNSVIEAARLLAEMNADLTSFAVKVNHFVGPENKFVNTEWRQNPSHQGGWVLDGGVHFAAVLRDLLGTINQKIVAVSAATSLIRQTLRPLDTVHAVLQASNGMNGTFVISNGVEFKSGIEVEITTTKGALMLKPTQVVVTTKDAEGKLVETVHSFPMTFGVKEEIAEFARCITKGQLDRRLTPAETMADLQLMEAMFESAASKGNVVMIA